MSSAPSRPERRRARARTARDESAAAWSALCFVGFFLIDVLLVIDVQLVPALDLSVWRTLQAAGLACLVYGLVWEADA